MYAWKIEWKSASIYLTKKDKQICLIDSNKKIQVKQVCRIESKIKENQVYRLEQNRWYSLDWVESQMDSNTIYCWEIRMWNQSFQQAHKINKLKIKIFFCFNSLPYKPFSLTSSTMNSSQYTNYILITNYTYSSFTACILIYMNASMNVFRCSCLVRQIEFLTKYLQSTKIDS